MKGTQQQSTNKAPRVRRSQQTVQEKEEIREYLARLRQIVPGCPKDGKISRLDLIQHVIDYIVQLQDTLVRNPRLMGTSADVTLADHPLPQMMHHMMTSAINMPVSMPVTPPMSPIHMANSQGVSPPQLDSYPPVSSTKSSKRQGNSSCRRPLGVLSSLNHHRNV